MNSFVVLHSLEHISKACLRWRNKCFANSYSPFVQMHFFVLIFYFQFQKSGIYVKERNGALFGENNSKTSFWRRSYSDLIKISQS